MTRLLEKALSTLKGLPAEKQDAIAAVIIEEIEDDRKWDALFEKSQDSLSKMAQRVREDVRAGRVKEMGFDEL